MGKVRGKTKEDKPKPSANGLAGMDIDMMRSHFSSNAGNSASYGALNSVSSAGRIGKPAKKSKGKGNLNDLSKDDLMSMGQMFSPMQMPPMPGSEFREPVSRNLQEKNLKNTMKKKDKMKAKKDEFQRKIANIKAEDKEKKEAAQRRQTPIVGDTRPMMNALPPVSAGPSAAAGSSNSGNPNPLLDLAGFVATHQLEEFKTLPKKKINSKQRQKEIAEGLAYFASTMGYQPPLL